MENLKFSLEECDRTKFRNTGKLIPLVLFAEEQIWSLKMPKMATLYFRKANG